MSYFIIGIIICFITMRYYDWPSKDDPGLSVGTSDYFPAIMWSCFIILFWPIVLMVWALGFLMQYFIRDGG